MLKNINKVIDISFSAIQRIIISAIEMGPFSYLYVIKKIIGGDRFIDQ